MISPILGPDALPVGPVKAANGPRLAIEAAWSEVERASKVKGRVVSAGPDLVALVNLLRSLRDRAARTDQSPPSPEEARRFGSLARDLVSRIEAIG